MTAQRIASCNCGALRALCQGEPVRISVCHCLTCKRRTGSAFSFNATFAREAVEIAGAFASFTRTTEAGRSTYSFCPTCGSTVFYAIDERPGRISIPAGAFGDPDFPEPTVSVCPDQQNPWVELRLAAPCPD